MRTGPVHGSLMTVLRVDTQHADGEPKTTCAVPVMLGVAHYYLICRSSIVGGIIRRPS
jgi:hypothetical protein